ncbi:MAG: DegT/DnrJ/EryC1/StrS family aminotransferase [Spirochaetes bacterium]|nr:DegT/DnrJ/EryC1/StrS family aminotransferase [Spirochaetota bacterium]
MNPTTDFVPFAKPSLGAEEEAAVLEVMRSGWLTTGKVALEFEKEFASFAGVPRALAVNSATSGLHLALEALKIGPGDVVVTSPYTFTSTAAVARHLGAEVAFCDVGKDGYDMDPSSLADRLATTRNCRAVMPVHVGGLPCDMDRILPMAKKYGCAVVEDAAHSFPSRLPSGLAGTLGDVGVYSFYVTKTITTGEGGMIVAKDDRLLSRMATMRMHGIDRAVWDRYTSKGASWKYGVIDAGFKYNLPDLLAAIGRAQLRKADRFLAERVAIARAYDEAFADRDYLALPPRGAGHAWHLYALRIVPGKLSIDRDAFIERLAALGVGSSVHFIPLHVMPYWSERYALKPGDFPNALETYERTVSLPAFQGMTGAQVERVVEAVVSVGDSARMAGKR